MNVLDLLKGKRIMVTTDVGVVVELEIKEVVQNHHSVDLEPATSKNDWWPASREWVTYTVIFTNGHSRQYNDIGAINVF